MKSFYYKTILLSIAFSLFTMSCESLCEDEDDNNTPEPQTTIANHHSDSLIVKE